MPKVGRNQPAQGMGCRDTEVLGACELATLVNSISSQLRKRPLSQGDKAERAIKEDTEASALASEYMTLCMDQTHS